MRPIGRVGGPHGLDGSFRLEGAGPAPEPGTVVEVAGRHLVVERLAGSGSRRLIRLAEVADRDAAVALRGEEIAVALADAPLEEDEWLSEDLVGCQIDGLGAVRRVVGAPSCDLLEVGPDGVLIPFVRDAIRHVDPSTRRIEVDRRFLGLEEGPADAARPRVP